MSEQPTHADIHRAIGSLEARAGNIERRMDEVAVDMKVLLAADERRKGERNIIAMIAATAASFGTLIITKLFPKLFN